MQGGQYPPEEGIAAHFSILAWKISWTEEPDGLQFPWWHRHRHDLAGTHACWVPLKSTIAQLLIHEMLTITHSQPQAL